LAALAGLLALLFVWKKKKMEPDIPIDQETTDNTTATVDDVGDYISEYGLSDGVVPMDGDEMGAEKGPLPDEPGSIGSREENFSEHNPEDLDHFEGEADEF
jgi:hypothetical protein